MKIFVETPRLILREILREDNEAIFAMDSDPNVHRYLGNKPLSSIAEVSAIIDFIHTQYVENGIGRWAVVEKESNSFIGWAGLKYITDVVNSHTNYYDLGYRFMQHAWGKGYATEAAKALLNYGFKSMDLTTIYAIADSDNTSSHHVLQKAGLALAETFEYDGSPHHWFYIDRPRN